MTVNTSELHRIPLQPTSSENAPGDVESWLYSFGMPSPSTVSSVCAPSESVHQENNEYDDYSTPGMNHSAVQQTVQWEEPQICILDSEERVEALRNVRNELFDEDDSFQEKEMDFSLPQDAPLQLTSLQGDIFISPVEQEDLGHGARLVSQRNKYTVQELEKGQCTNNAFDFVPFTTEKSICSALRGSGIAAQRMEKPCSLAARGDLNRPDQELVFLAHSQQQISRQKARPLSSVDNPDVSAFDSSSKSFRSVADFKQISIGNQEERKRSESLCSEDLDAEQFGKILVNAETNNGASDSVRSVSTFERAFEVPGTLTDRLQMSSSIAAAKRLNLGRHVEENAKIPINEVSQMNRGPSPLTREGRVAKAANSRVQRRAVRRINAAAKSTPVSLISHFPFPVGSQGPEITPKEKGRIRNREAVRKCRRRTAERLKKFESEQQDMACENRLLRNAIDAVQKLLRARGLEPFVL